MTSNRYDLYRALKNELAVLYENVDCLRNFNSRSVIADLLENAKKLRKAEKDLDRLFDCCERCDCLQDFLKW